MKWVSVIKILLVLQFLVLHIEMRQCCSVSLKSKISCNWTEQGGIRKFETFSLVWWSEFRITELLSCLGKEGHLPFPTTPCPWMRNYMYLFFEEKIHSSQYDARKNRTWLIQLESVVLQLKYINRYITTIVNLFCDNWLTISHRKQIIRWYDQSISRTTDLLARGMDFLIDYEINLVN